MYRPSLLLLLTLLAGSPAQAQQKKARPPRVPKGSILRPEFGLASSKKLRAGTAVVVTIDKKQPPVVLTAWHLFGPAGGMPDQIAAKDLSTAVRSLALRRALTGRKPRKPIRCGAPLHIPESGALFGPPASKAGDVVAFKAPKSARSMALPLAKKNPAAQDPLWLLGQAGRSPKRLHRVTCQGVHEGALAYIYADGSLRLRATSGAAIVNAKGEVVGINFGGGKDDEGRLWGQATPVEKFRPFVLRALTSSKKARK